MVTDTKKIWGNREKMRKKQKGGGVCFTGRVKAGGSIILPDQQGKGAQKGEIRPLGDIVC